LLRRDPAAERPHASHIEEVMKKIEGPLVSLLFVGVGIGGVLYGARGWMPELASRHGAGIDAMLRYLLVTVGGLFLVGYVALGWLIWRGTRRAAIGTRLASHRAEVVLSVALGLGVAAIGEGGVLAIGIPVWNEYFGAEPLSESVTIEVTAQQFMWNVRYPGPDGIFGRTTSASVDEATNPLGRVLDDPAGRDDILTLNEITIPVDQRVRIVLRSKDVIHSFFLPHFRVKQDAVPGMAPHMVFTPTRLGDFELACAELCGLAHYRMRGFVHVLTAQQFADWLLLQSAADPSDPGGQR
jgi:cytochrome c oxidase subunit 2